MRTDDGETFDTTAPRDAASAFCSHLALAVREQVEEITGVRYRLVFAGCLQPSQLEPDSRLLN